MSQKKRGLGKGLSELGIKELLSDPIIGEARTTHLPGQSSPRPSAKDAAFKHVPIKQIIPGRAQPRKIMDQEAINMLAQSIRSQGILQPIVVRPGLGQSYEILAGERRWRAAQIAGLTELSVIIRTATDEAAVAIGLIENIQRQALNSIEEAMALQRLVHEFSLTHQQVADSVGRSRAAISNLLRLLNLNTDVKKMLESGQIEMGHARALLVVEGAEQSQLAKQVISQNLSVRQTEELVRKRQNPVLARTSESVTPPEIDSIKELLSVRLGAPVQIKHKEKGHGKLVIDYRSVQELEKILMRLE